jgi:hypothetical protein
MLNIILLPKRGYYNRNQVFATCPLEKYALVQTSHIQSWNLTRNFVKRSYTTSLVGLSYKSVAH